MMSKPIELEFRDGKRVVPEYLVAILSGLETFRMTYDEAIAEANKVMERNHIAAAMSNVRTEHLRNLT